MAYSTHGGLRTFLIYALFDFLFILEVTSRTAHGSDA